VAKGGLLQTTYSQIEDIVPENDITYHGQVELAKIPVDKVQDFGKIVGETKLPSSPLKPPKGEGRWDSKSWVEYFVHAVIESGIIAPDVADKLEEVPRTVMMEGDIWGK